MPIVITEFYRTNALAFDDKGKVSGGTRTFKAQATQVLPVAAAFTEYPGYDQLPGYPQARYQGARMSLADSGSVVEIEAQYGTARSSTLQPPRDEPTYYFVGWGMRRVEVDVPSNVRGFRNVVVGGSSTNIVKVWESEILKVMEVRPRRVFSTRIQSGDVSIFDAAAYQLNNIHTINGQKWQFVDVDVRERDGTFFDVEYTWEVDRGTPLPVLDDPANYTIEVPANAPQGLVRAPYETLKPIPSRDPENMPHPTISIAPFVDDPDGWQQLPGTTLL